MARLGRAFPPPFIPARQAPTAVAVSVFDYVASGGLTIGGAADVATTKNYVASGGLTIGGAALTEFKKAAAAVLPIGGFAFPLRPTIRPQVFSYVASGGLTIGGAAETRFRPVQVFVYTSQPVRKKLRAGGPGADIRIVRVVDVDEETLLRLMLEDEL